MSSISCRKSELIIATSKLRRLGHVFVCPNWNCVCLGTLHTWISLETRSVNHSSPTSSLHRLCQSLCHHSFKWLWQRFWNLSRQPRTFQLYVWFVYISSIVSLIGWHVLHVDYCLYAFGEMCCFFLEAARFALNHNGNIFFLPNLIRIRCKSFWVPRCCMLASSVKYIHIYTSSHSIKSQSSLYWGCQSSTNSRKLNNKLLYLWI